MSKKKKALSRQEVAILEGQSRYEASFPKVVEAIEQISKKEGPIYERWKAGMRRYLDSLEEKKG